jgi:hypothetical protein
MKAIEIENELHRISEVIGEAEASGKILVHSGCGDENNPYPIFFTAEELKELICKGSWHCVNWYLVDKEIIKEKIFNRINELQKRLMKL